jgi:uncharacterized protein (TIGR02117 family)
MRYVRTTGRFVYRTLELLLFGISCWILFALALPAIVINPDFTPAKNGIPVFIHSNGVHTDFVVPVRNEIIHWDTLFPPAIFHADSGFTHLALGWGDQGFFLHTPTWNDLTFSTAFIAASGLGESAMHVTYRKSAPAKNARAVTFMLSAEQYTRLVNYIRSSFRIRENKVQLIDHAGYGANDKFFESNGSYSLFKTCNEWTGDGMEEAGLPVGIWTPLEQGIMSTH